MTMRARILKVALASAVLAASMVMPSRADILDNILDVSTTARDRATAARDRAKEARDFSEEMRTNMLDGVVTLSTDLRDAISEAIEDAQRVIVEEKEGRDAFIADGGCSVDTCQPFRQKLVGMMVGLETLLNTLGELAGGPGDLIDLQREITIVQNLPGRLLYPLYRVLEGQTGIFDGDIVQEINDTVQQLLVIASFMVEPIEGYTGNGFEFEFERDFVCQLMLENPGVVRGAALGLRIAALRWKASSKLILALGKTSIEPQGAIWGWAGANIKTDAATKIGTIMGGVADQLFQIASYSSSKMQHCAMVGSIDNILQNQAALEVKQQETYDLLYQIARRLQMPGFFQ